MHYGHALGAALGGGTPVAVTLASGTYSTRATFGAIPPVPEVPVPDAMAALTAGGAALSVMLVHRSAAAGPIRLVLDLGPFPAAPEAAAVTLAGSSPHDENTLDEPDRVVPRRSRLGVEGSRATLALPPYSLTRLTFRAAR